MQPPADAQQQAVVTYKVEEVARLLGLSRNAAYAAVKAGEIPSLKFGRRVVVPRAAFEAMLAAAGRPGPAERVAA